MSKNAPASHLASRSKKILGVLLRVALVLLAFFLLYTTLRQTNADILQDLKKANHFLLAVIAISFGIIFLLSAFRWKMLMDVQGMRLPFLALLKLTMTGAFFSLFIPGVVSGDVVKIAYAKQAFPGRITEITLTVILDRILGLAGLFVTAFLITLISLPTLWPLFHSYPQLLWGVLAVNIGCLGVLLLYLFYRCRPLLQRIGFIRKGGQKVARLLPAFFTNVLQRFFSALDLYHKNQRVLFYHLSISAFIHFFFGICYFGIGKALHETVMTFQQYQITMQLSNASGIIPATPGGIGLRDLIGSIFFKVFQASPREVCGSIPVSYTLLILFWAAVCGLVFMFSTNLKQYRK